MGRDRPTTAVALKRWLDEAEARAERYRLALGRITHMVAPHSSSVARDVLEVAESALGDAAPGARTDAAELARRRDDARHAAGELLVPLPEPGTDAARMLVANRLMRGERDEAQRACLEATGRATLAEARAAAAEQALATPGGKAAARAEIARLLRALDAETDRRAVLAGELGALAGVALVARELLRLLAARESIAPAAFERECDPLLERLQAALNNAATHHPLKAQIRGNIPAAWTSGIARKP